MSDQPEARSGPLVLGLGVLALCFAVVLVRSVPPPPAPDSAPPTVFSAGRASQILRTLVGDGVPHFVGTDANARVRGRVVAALEAAGIVPQVQEAFACGQGGTCATVHNVLARLPGRETGKAVLLATHYDSVAAGPGASDAGISVAAVIEIARILKSQPAGRNPVILLVDDGEEAGLLGALAFVTEHPWARDVGAVVNLEARGTSGQSVMFETSRDNAWLVDLLARSLARPAASSLFYPVYERLPNDTDLTVFKRAGLAGVNFAFIGDVPRYHTPLDNVDYASLTSLQHQGDNALAAVRALADADLDTRPAGDAVFFDVLGLGLVRWPAGWTVALAAVAVLLLVVTVFASRRGGAAPLWRALVGLVSWALMVGICGLGVWGLRLGLTRFAPLPGEATTRPALAVLAFWCAGLALVVLVAAVFERWTRREGAWAGCWLGWALAGLAAASYIPETSYLLIVPSLVAGVAGVFASLVRGRPPGGVSMTLPLVAAALLWMPPAWFLFDALGPMSLPVTGGAVGILATTLAPFVAGAGRLRWAAPVIALAATVTLLAGAVQSAGVLDRMAGADEPGLLRGGGG